MSRLSRFIHFYTDEDEGNGGGGDPGILKTVSGALIHITDALAKPLKKLVVNLEPVQSGSGDPSPENVRPITGHTGANVVRTGKNVIDIPNLSGISVSNNQMTQIPNGFRLTKTQASSDYSPRIFYLPDWVAGKTITFSADITITGTQNGGIRAIAYSGVYTQKVSYGDVIGTSGRISKTITFPDSLPSDADGFAINFYCAYSTPANVGDYTDYTNVMAELSSPATEYEPYQSTTIPITFPAAAGTVYGGTLTINDDGSGSIVVNGICEDVKANVNLYVRYDSRVSGKSYYGRAATVEFACSINVENTAKQIELFTHGKIGNPWAYDSNGANASYILGTTIRIGSFDYNNLEDWKSYVLSQDSMLLYYPLATPITYQLTSQQVLTLLQGENNVWSDANGELELTYYAKAEETP